MDQLFERAAVGIAQLDTSGHYLLANDRYCEMLARTREELLAARIHDVTHTDDLPTTLDGLIRVIETGIPAVIDQRCIRGDGEEVWIGNTVSVGRDRHGKPQYVLALAQDVTVRKRTEFALTRVRDDLRLLLDTAADGFYCVDRSGLTTLCNRAFLRMLGFRSEDEVNGKDLHAVIHHTRADGSPYPREQCPILTVAESGRHVHVVDERFFRVDGTSFPIEYWARPIVREGEIQGAVCTFVDLTERKRAEERQELLNRELAHRVKNTLAMVQAIVSQTLRNAATPADAIESINQRLVALGNAHTILMRTPHGNASMTDVVEGAIAAHRADPRRIEVVGPRIELGAKAALAITLAVHELATNAAKYGALSNDGGSIALEWTVTGGAADAALHVSWKERNGPAVIPPQRKGFGSRLVSRAIAADLQGEATLQFDPDGVLWTLQAPIAAMKQ